MHFHLSRFLLVFIFFSFISSAAFAQPPTADFIVADPDGCAPHTANFTSTSTGTGLSYTWNFGDPNAPGPSTQQNPSHNYALPGQYTVTLTVSNANGTDVETKTNFITVFEGPTANYTVSEDTVCANVPITFTDNSTPGDGVINQWQWSFNDGSPTVTGSASVQHSYTNTTLQVRTFIPVFTIVDANGCNSIYSGDTVIILPAPGATISFTTSGCTFPATVTFSNTSPGPNILSWNFGDPSSGANNTSTLDQPTHTYTTSGTYTVTLTNGVSGCSATDQIVLTLTPPTAAFQVQDPLGTPDTIICLFDTAFFENQSTPMGTSSQWTFGDASPVSFTANPFHIYNAPGTYTVTLTSTLGSCTSTTTHIVRVPPLPPVQIGADDQLACDIPFTVNFTNTTPNIAAWSWNFFDPPNDTSNLQNPSHTYNNFGNYTVGLTVTDSFGCVNSANFTNYIRIQAPTVNFSQEDSGCVGDVFPYNAIVNSPSDPIISSYIWDFGDGTPPDTVTTPGTTHQFNTVGIFDITLTIITSTGCTVTLTKPAYARVGTKPIAAMYQIDTTICFKGNVAFRDSSYPQPITGWQWSFGDGGGSQAQDPNHQYNLDTSGTSDPFDVTLIVYYNGCESDPLLVQDIITVISPIPNFGTVYDCNNPNFVTFNNLSGGANTYTWDYGDGSPFSNDTNTTHTYPGRGSYDVVLTSTNGSNGCIVDTTLNVVVTDIIAEFTATPQAVCFPDTIFFSGINSQDAINFLWDFGDPGSGSLNTSTSSSPYHIYNAPGFFNVKLTATDIHNCPDDTIIQVHMLGPTAHFNGTPRFGCPPPLNVTFHDSTITEGGAISQWVWNFGNGTGITTNADTASTTYNVAGIYTISVTVTDVNGCTDRDTLTNYISVSDPIAGIALPDTNACRNVAEIFTATTGVVTQPVTYSWDFGDGQTSVGTTNPVSHAYTNNGPYHVTLHITDGAGCSDSTSRDIFVFTTSAHFTFDTLAECVVGQDGIKKAHVKATFHSDSLQYTSNANYDWDLTVYHDPNSSFADYTYDYNVPPGAYDATLILTNDLGCKDTMTVPGAVVVPGPSGSFTFAPDSGCSPLTVNFTGTSTNSNLYSWDFGDGTVINGTPDNVQTHTYTAVGIYTPQYYLGFQISNDLCYIPVPTQGPVKVTSLVGVDILEDSIFVTDGERDTLTVIVNDPFGNGPYDYNWTPQNYVINGPFPGTFLATTTGIDQYYYVAVPYGNQGCSGIDSVLVRYKLCETLLKIPNVFTPDDGNQFNNVYEIKDLCLFEDFRFRIYNRWGRIIFESTDPKFQWDGTTTGGSKASEGVYYYVLNAKTQEIHGWIDLIRNRR